MNAMRAGRRPGRPVLLPNGPWQMLRAPLTPRPLAPFGLPLLPCPERHVGDADRHINATAAAAVVPQRVAHARRYVAGALQRSAGSGLERRGGGRNMATDAPPPSRPLDQTPEPPRMAEAEFSSRTMAGAPMLAEIGAQRAKAPISTSVGATSGGSIPVARHDLFDWRLRH